MKAFTYNIWKCLTGKIERMSKWYIFGLILAALAVEVWCNFLPEQEKRWQGGVTLCNSDTLSISVSWAVVLILSGWTPAPMMLRKACWGESQKKVTILRLVNANQSTHAYTRQAYKMKKIKTVFIVCAQMAGDQTPNSLDVSPWFSAEKIYYGSIQR